VTSTDPPAGELVLRPAAPEDAEAVAGVYLATREAAVPAMPPQIHTPDEVREHTRREIARQETWVATDGPDGAVIGYAALSGAWLEGLYVAPGHQGQGVGTALLELAMARRPRGFALWVFASNEGARRLYRRHGLVELEHTDGSGNEERSPDVRMDWPGQEPMSYFRAGIDAVDDEIAVLLARRQALAAAVQDRKAPGGHAGRDPERERAIAERMARHAPGLGADRMAQVMDTVISVGLDAWEKRRDASADAGGGEVG